MSTNYIDGFVKCPYYKTTDKYSVSCKDEFSKNTAYILSKVFKNQDSKKSHLKRYCCEEYKQCEIFRLLEKKTEQE